MDTGTSAEVGRCSVTPPRMGSRQRERGQGPEHEQIDATGGLGGEQVLADIRPLGLEGLQVGLDAVPAAIGDQAPRRRRYALGMAPAQRSQYMAFLSSS
jgi:hypothetical protein